MIQNRTLNNIRHDASVVSPNTSVSPSYRKCATEPEMTAKRAKNKNEGKSMAPTKPQTQHRSRGPTEIGKPPKRRAQNSNTEITARSATEREKERKDPKPINNHDTSSYNTSGNLKTARKPRAHKTRKKNTHAPVPGRRRSTTSRESRRTPRPPSPGRTGGGPGRFWECSAGCRA